MGGKRTAFAVCLICVVSTRAFADDLDQRPEGGPTDRPGLSYLVDGGAIPFLWAPIATRIALDAYARPRSTPLGFSSSEGGAEKASWQTPGWGISALGGVLALGMIGGGDASRYYHVKGLAEALATGCVITAGLKVAFGRRRPDWDATRDSPGSRRSFPSGHATQAFAIATYAALYLRRHVFAGRRGDSAMPWWEAATYGGLLVGAGALAGERVLHNRHHLTDVGAGALLGTATSTLFFLYQDRRYKDHAREATPVSLSPGVGGGTGASAGMSMSFVW